MQSAQPSLDNPPWASRSRDNKQGLAKDSSQHQSHQPASGAPHQPQVRLLSCPSLLSSSSFIFSQTHLLLPFAPTPSHCPLFFVCHFSRLLEGQKAQRSWSHSLSGLFTEPTSYKADWQILSLRPGTPAQQVISTRTGLRPLTKVSISNGWADGTMDIGVYLARHKVHTACQSSWITCQSSCQSPEFLS